jgi:enoyl-CoA hydratase/carnithine racemase
MRGAPEAMALTKLAMNKVWETEITSGLNYEIEAESVAMSCENFFEAMEAMEEQRAPVFKKPERIS